MAGDTLRQTGSYVEPGESRAIRVPVGADASRWSSRQTTRKVLFVVHNVTSAGRLLDLVPLFHDDFRVQLLVTSTGSSAFQGGIRELFAELELPVLPWEQALETRVDLAISASFGGQLPLIQGKLAILSHGVGYTKKLHGSREPGAGSREPGAGSREPGAGSREPTFGLSAEWLLTDDGRPYVDAFVLSHPEQLDRLRHACPEAVDSAVLAGDPCFDRMLAADAYRDRFRRALGVRRGQRLVVLNSTWNPEGLFGDGGEADLLPSLLPRLTAELPADDYRLAAVLHPNIWHGHGPGQIRAWLDRALRSGLTLVDPVRSWRQALLAADVVVSDFGAVSYYAAALGTPVLIASTSQARLAPDTPLAAFHRQAPRLNPHAALHEQLDTALAEHRPDPEAAEFTSAEPHRSAFLLRRRFYALMDLPEPASPALLEPLPLPPHTPPERTAPLYVRARVRGQDVWLERSTGHPRAAWDTAHLAVHETTRDPTDLELAQILFRYGRLDDPRLGGAAGWTAEVLGRHRYCDLAAYVTSPHTCTVRTRAQGLYELTGQPGADADPAAYASALHAWLAAARGVPAGGMTLRVRLARGTHPVEVVPAGAHGDTGRDQTG